MHLCIDMKFNLIVSGKFNKNKFGFLLAYLSMLQPKMRYVQGKK